MRLTRSTSSSDMASGSGMPRIALIAEAVVQAMPLVVNAPVVAPVGPGERGGELAADPDGQLPAVELLPAVGEDVIAVAGGEVDELVGELVVVLQRVHQRGRVDPQRQSLVHRQPQELGVAHGQRVVVGGAVDEVIGQVGAGLAHRLDVVHGEVELLEGEAPHLADHAGDELVGRL